MTFTRDDARKEVQAQVQEDADFITPDEVNRFIASGLRHLNRDRPLTKVADITGDDTKTYDLAPTGFTKGLSKITNVEFPAGEDPPINRVEDDDWREYEDPSKPAGQQIRLLFITVTPTTTETIRITFQSPWTLDKTDASQSDLDETAFGALVHKATALLLRSLSNRFAQTTDPTIAADAVDYAGRSSLFAFNAAEHERMYKEMTGLSEDVPASQAMAESDIKFVSGEGMFWHPNRTH